MDKHSPRRKHDSGIRRLEKQLKSWNPDCTLSSSPQKALAIGNAGFACGFSHENIMEELMEVCSSQTSVRHSVPPFSVTMIPDKPFAIVHFVDENESEHVLDAVCGRPVRSDSGSEFPWFPAFVAGVGEILLARLQSVCRQLLCQLAHENLEYNPAANFPVVTPPGLHYFPDFVTLEEEARLTDFVENAMGTASSKDVLRNRTALHYGYKFMYGLNHVNVDNESVEEIPGVCLRIGRKLVDSGFLEMMPDQLTINIYAPGQGIPAHVDTHSVFENGICSVSLGSPVVMEFSRGSNTIPIILHPRSALAMKDECRYAWKHGIAPRTTDCMPGASGMNSWRRGKRISLTFRCVRNRPCTCSFPDECDSQHDSRSGSCGLMNTADVHEGEITLDPLLEENHVYQVYDDIAPHFSQTRYKPWPKVVDFLNSIPAGSIVADVGCGNGKYLGLSKQTFEVGCDRSVNLIDICRDRKLEVLVSDVLSLPFRDGCCDAVLCIAVIHHLSTQDRRIKAIRELMRVLSVHGRALVYVWALEQKKDQKASTYLKVDKTATTCAHDAVEREQTVDVLPCEIQTNDTAGTAALPIHTNRTQFKQQDILVPWHIKSKRKECGAVEHNDEVFHRYYHVFREGELQEYCEQISNIEVSQSYYDEGNWCVILRKCC